jgi:coenzyme F420-reducing hydrogenase beta subunit
MKNAPTHNCGESVPVKRDYTPGMLPRRLNTVRAEVLAALLKGDDMTGMDSVFAQNTTRLSAVICSLEKDYGWPVQRRDLAVHTKDGRVVWIAVYFLHQATIDAAVINGALPWMAAVKTARAKQKRQAKWKQDAALLKAIRKELRQYDPRQLVLWSGQ